jgi:hypothetical protein
VQSSARVYEDAGQGLGYQRGEFALSNFTLRVAGRRTVLGIEGGALVLGSPSAPPRWGTAHAPLNWHKHAPLHWQAPPTQLPSPRRRFEVRFRGAPPSACNYTWSPSTASSGAAWFWWEQRSY